MIPEHTDIRKRGQVALTATGGGGVSVEVQVLFDAAARLEGLKVTMGDLAGRHALSAHIDAGDTGRVEAAEAIRSFLHRWSYGLDCLRSDIASMASALRHAAEAYEKVEAEIVAGGGG
jgi:hypothetical protein